MSYMEEKNGSKDMTRLRRADVIKAQKANIHRARFSNLIPAVLSVLCEHAIDEGWTKANPAKGVRKIPIPKEKQRPHTPWTDEAIKKWREEADFLPRLIFEIGLGSVQRPGDWVDFNWGDYDGFQLILQQNKTEKPLKLPCTQILKRTLDEAKARLGREPDPSEPILTTLFRGDRMTYTYMSQHMRKERHRLGLQKFDLHALRYRGVMELAWAGCDDAEIASYSGHDTTAMIKKYAGEARQQMRARQAWEKRQ